MTVDYKSTVKLPRTSFPMRAGLPTREPELLSRWQAMDLYHRQRAQSLGREKFILHDGPPYANGHIHIGTALNKILKDVVSRSQQMLGYDSVYVPGWDCHGLPIEWNIEKLYRKAGRNKDDVPVVEFRRECRDFASSWIDVQRDEFRRLGVLGDWDNPYTTMSFAAEAQIVREFAAFLQSGQVYRGAKPVLWSVPERTALADAEVEYHDHRSTTIFVRFPIAEAKAPESAGADVVIWTTTPWTIPGNRAVAYGDGVDYVVLAVTEVQDGALARVGDRLVVADALIADLTSAAGITGHRVEARLKGSAFEGTVLRHPLAGQGYDFAVPMLPAEFVDVETGTGFVHIAPGHGQDDWELGMQYGVPVPDTVGPDGAFLDHVPLFAGRLVLRDDGSAGDANGAVVEALTAAGRLVASNHLVHSYPHSWRSKAPLIFRNTPQWFISMEAANLRAKALAAIDETRFIPAAGQRRLRGMIESRPDWCVSRQRMWGVPITLFVHKVSGEPLLDPAVMDRVIEAVAEEGADVWFSADPRRFLGDDYDPGKYDQVRDILEVWFDSGSTHSYVLEARDDLKWPASLYLEGSDQHRGWFHTSLLESCGTRGRAPYEAVLTHGFVMAEDGYKMSKSRGNTVSPMDVAKDHGADILRLWVVGSDYSEDLRIGPEILKQHADVYRRLRNTLRFLLGNLDGFSAAERVPMEQMPELERWVLHRVWVLDRDLRTACRDLQFHGFFAELHTFCTVDLSAFYFDVRKDSLYCDSAASLTRRSARTVLDVLFDHLVTWLAPFTCFTAEEAWQTRYPTDDGSVHLQTFPVVPDSWRDEPLAARWEQIRRLRRVVTGALELEREQKSIGSSLQAAPVIFAGPDYQAACADLDLAELAITSAARFDDGEAPADAYRLPDVPDVAVLVPKAEGEKCERCWKVLTSVGTDTRHPTLCSRCADVVEQVLAAAE